MQLENGIRRAQWDDEVKYSMISPAVTRKRSLRTFPNKPTVLYWAHSAQHHDTCRLVPFACIYKDWFRYHDNNPEFGFEHFFRQFNTNNLNGPQDSDQNCEAHRSFCDRAASLLDMDRQAEEVHLQDYHMLPLCRAIIVILDEMPPKQRARVVLEEEA